jgi:Patatin-like phospholipase
LEIAMPEPTEFNTVLDAELTQIDERRRRRELAEPPPVGGVNPGGGPVQATPPLADIRQAAHKRELVGLAFSGGSIRSATFNLGILQGLAGLGLLKYFDYLSTVSGGGYIGAWLTAWIQRRATASVPPPSAADEVELKLKTEQ